MGQCDVRGPEVFWMSDWDNWYTLYFYMVVIRGGGVTMVINTGPPPDLSALNDAWERGAGDPRARLARNDDERPRTALSRLGIAPEDVDYVLVTPLQAYATGNIPLFERAQVCVSRRGWIEDLHAPSLPLHVPRELRMPDDVLRYLMFDARDRVRLLNDEDTVVDGVRAFWAGAHHRSSMVFVIDTPRGRVAVTDTVFHYANLEAMRPLGIAESLQEVFTTYERLRREADFVIPLYDPAVLQRFPGGVVCS
jgi:glyoxylase-like metal-dependent hydrolase (beta-lactamase superfamily II)